MVFNSTFKDVASVAIQVLNYAAESFSAAWSQPMSTEWVVLWCFVLFTLFLCAVCACGDFLSRVYPDHQHRQAPPKPLPQLITPSASQVSPDDDKTPESTRDPEHGESSRTTRRRKQDGIIASTCDAHRILVNGSPSSRLNKKVCKRQGVKLATLLISDKLHPSGLWRNRQHLDASLPNCARSIENRTFRIENRDGAMQMIVFVAG